jgi:hypothetical protein
MPWFQKLLGRQDHVELPSRQAMGSRIGGQVDIEPHTPRFAFKPHQ